MRRLALHQQHGFTLIEVMVAMVVLVIGLFGVMTLLDQASATTTSNKAREQGVALQRELVEAARGIPYSQLTPASVVSQIRQTPGFNDCAAAGAVSTSCSTIGSQGWTVIRRGITFHVTAGVCSVDDANDGLGQHIGDMFCATGGGQANSSQCRTALGTSGDVRGTGTATGTVVGDCGIDLNYDGKVDKLTESETGVTSPNGSADTNPDDYKRIVTLVRWDRGAGSHFALQSTSLPYPGLSGAPRVTGLSPDGFGNPIITETSAHFLVTTNRQAASVAWFVSGTPAGTGTDNGGGALWDFTWDLGTPGPSGAAGPATGEVLDGTYNIGARALDIYGSAGPTKWYTVTVNRRVPYQPRAVEVVRSDNVVWTRWAASSEGDIEGYEVYRKPSAGGTATLVCPLQKETFCAESSSLPSTGTYDYYVYAYDRAPDGTLRRGDESEHRQVPFDNKVPDPPINVTAARVGNQVTLTWAPPPNGDPDDALRRIAKYRVYRDGTKIVDRYFETGNATQLSMTDSSVLDGQHSYWVVAVDTQGAESRAQGPVTA
jgi:prepilin-type N-terminal cleavage/methylation domain-containing protein